MSYIGKISQIIDFTICTAKEYDFITSLKMNRTAAFAFIQDSCGSQTL
jgi:hypothetical protein